MESQNNNTETKKAAGRIMFAFLRWVLFIISVSGEGPEVSSGVGHDVILYHTTLPHTKSSFSNV